MFNFIKSVFADEIDESLKIQMDVLDTYGIKYIEMRGVNGKNVTQYTSIEMKEIKRELDIRGFKVSAIGSPIGKIKITDEFASHLELFKHTLELAKILETKYIRMFSFFIPEGENADEHRKEVINRWKQFIEVAKGYDVVLLHENEKDIYGDTPERCLDLLQTLNCDFLKATFDPANFIQCDCETYPSAFEMLYPHIEYIHIKDAYKSNHKVVPAGYGDGKIFEILSKLKEDGFDGFLSLEPHLSSFKGFADLEPNSATNNMEDSGQKQFAIAVEALNKILESI